MPNHNIPIGGMIPKHIAKLTNKVGSETTRGLMHYLILEGILSIVVGIYSQLRAEAPTFREHKEEFNGKNKIKLN